MLNKQMTFRERMKEESNPRIPRKKGQPANSKKHSDLYTDENPKGTIHGLGFQGLLLLKHLSQRSGILLDDAHKIQLLLLWNKGQERWVKPLKQQSTEKFINSMKKKTKQMNEAISMKDVKKLRKAASLESVSNDPKKKKKRY